MGELFTIPNIGKATERALTEMGYTTIESLKGKKGEEPYNEQCALRGTVVDRCQLYLYRAVEYFVNTANPDIEKCKWWYWKDEFVSPSPCGAICSQCSLFPSACKGCRRIKGKVHWLQYTGADCCPIYDCCINNKRQQNCSACKNLPCERFVKDPTISDEQNEQNLKTMLKNLGKQSQ